MLLLDTLWLTMNMVESRTIFAAIQGTPLSIRWIPAGIVYTVMIAAVWFFAVRDTKDRSEVAMKGAAIGLAMYTTYDMTMYATVAKYPLAYALKDMAWGTFLCAASATAATFA